MTSWRKRIISPPRHFVILNRIAVPLLAILTILFLLLPGISGPQTGFYWLDVKYKNQNNITTFDNPSRGNSFGNAGEIWQLGGLGACKLGERCQSDQEFPAFYKPIQQVLQLHFAIIFFIISWFSFVIFKFPQANITRRGGTLLPLLGPFFTSIILMSDLCIAHSLEIKANVEQVKKIGVFWLGTIGFIFSILWCISAELDGMYKRIEFAESEKPDKEPAPELGIAEKAVQGVASLWPWKGERKDRERSRRRDGGGHKRSKSRSDRSRSERKSKSRSDS
uniref:Uncharacterized protein n=1 Tax=Kwoniella pini CBS 10737 TaxID=1296096 RepID=A0A1B9I0E3_9TREE|nr:uncharacterized protein I206_04625 [Kwoniella pini CBS 10737]OCF48938.1 hypothetical protein I206_04625 [Kwoniella pini CBS 10737]